MWFVFVHWMGCFGQCRIGNGVAYILRSGEDNSLAARARRQGLRDWPDWTYTGGGEWSMYMG